MPANRQREHSTEGDRGTAWALGLWLGFPSIGFVQEHVGTWAVPLFLGVVVGVVVWGWRAYRIPEDGLARHFGWIALACVVGLTAGHLLLHPYEDGRGPGHSSDRDEALEIAVGRLLDGDDPYYQESPVAGPLSVLPGGILLSVPFVMLGKVGLMNVVWLGVFLFVMFREFGSARRALFLFVLFFATSIAAMYEFVSGGDLIANSIYVAVGCWGCLGAWSGDRPHRGLAVASAVFLGVAVASRANFPLLCPLLVAWIWRRWGLSRAVRFALLVAGVSIGLIAGFYFADPSGFTPFMSRGKLMIHGAPGWFGQAVLAGTLLAVVIFAIGFLVSRRPPDHQRFFRACAWVTLLPMLAMMVAASLLHGRPDFSILHDRFGLMCVPFALLGWGSMTKATTEEEPGGSKPEPAAA